MRFGKHVARPPPAKEASVAKSAESELVALQKEKDVLKDEVQRLRAGTKERKDSSSRTRTPLKQLRSPRPRP